MLVRQSNPAQRVTRSRAMPMRPAREFLSPASASARSTASSSASFSVEAEARIPARSLSNRPACTSDSAGNVIMAQRTMAMARMTVPAFLMYCQVRSQVWISSPLRVGIR